jgi:hypothetical protein
MILFVGANNDSPLHLLIRHCGIVPQSLKIICQNQNLQNFRINRIHYFGHYFFRHCGLVPQSL